MAPSNPLEPDEEPLAFFEDAGGTVAEGPGAALLGDVPPPRMTVAPPALASEPQGDGQPAPAPIAPAVLEEGLKEAMQDRVVKRLLRQEMATERQVRDAYTQWLRKNRQDTLWRWVARHPDVDRERVFGEAARLYAFARAEVGRGSPKPEFVTAFVEALPGAQQEQLLAYQFLPVGQEHDEARGVTKVIFAAEDPGNADAQTLLSTIGLEAFEVRYAPGSEINPLLRELFPKRNEFLERMHDEEWHYDLGATFDQGKSSLVDEDAIEAEINRSGLINLFEASLVEAVRMGASDIHIWPNAERQTEFHMRVDGELQHWHTEGKVHPEALLAVAKDRSGNVDRFEREAAQDGYIQRKVDGALIRYRVSILPIATANREIRAESIVIRVLDDRKVMADLGQLGLLEGALLSFKKAITQPHGMVVLTGPTGSGKSTTLVASLAQVVRPQVNALTIEDPVEYIIKGVRQIKLGPRLSMDQALRSVLRHDPDIVMVGEMRDRQTAELAVKLANTGHLTFSTLHTNDAPSAVSRLYKMGIEPFLIAYAINLVVAQRLLRTLCDKCKQVDQDLDMVLLRQVGFTEDEIATSTFYVPGDDPQCQCKGVGYKGRRAIAEALYFSRAIRHLIVSASEEIDEDAIRTTAVKEGMLTLQASAREIVKHGQTSVEEVLRVTTSDD